jgi:hypothetical protein
MRGLSKEETVVNIRHIHHDYPNATFRVLRVKHTGANTLGENPPRSDPNDFL